MEMATCLLNMGHRVYLHYAYNGDNFSAAEAEVDVIFTSTGIARRGVSVFTEELCNRFPQIPVIFLAASTEIDKVSTCLEAGAADFITRPVNYAKLELLIERNIQRWRMQYRRIEDGKKSILIKIITPLMRALDAKDHLTGAHTLRVVNLALAMADEVGLNEDDRFILQMAAYLHDIGKIGMPDGILKKNSRLEDEELKQVRDHAVVGGEIVGEIPELRPVAKIIRHHHERYDGLGYPDGLKRDEIPAFSRMLSIIDAYEALVSDRVYRKGVTAEEALEEIRRHSGTQFDPNITEAFCRVITRRLFSDRPESENPEPTMVYTQNYCRTAI